MLLLLTVVMMQAQDKAAEELFRKYEKSLSAAKSIAVDLQAVLNVHRSVDDYRSRSEFSGSLQFKPGGKTLLKLKAKNAMFETLTFRSDGKTMWSSFNGEGRGGPIKSDQARELVNLYRSILARTGLWVMGVGWPKNGKKKGQEENPRMSSGASGFRSAGEETIDKIRATIIEYQGSFSGQKFHVKLWLDASNLVPLKRVCTIKDPGKESVVTEKYSGFSTREIPDENFRSK